MCYLVTKQFPAKLLFILKILFITQVFLIYNISVQASTTCAGSSQRGVKRVQSHTVRQHALVVGIDKYRYIAHKNLEGAANDAKVIGKALKNAGIPTQILLDDQATRAKIVESWCNMVAQAQAGDTLIFTYAGHGGQERDTPPIDEKDKRDETLMLHDFDPTQPNQGRIKDDELFALFEEAKDYKILFVSDSCHSRGMVRSLAEPPSGLKVRTVNRVWDIPSDAPQPFPNLPMRSDEESLPHVTMITAVDKEHLTVPETIIGGETHGALSWFFAEALSGQADGNNNGQLERDELDRFLKQKVTVHMKNSQTPKLLPKGDSTPLITLSVKFTKPSFMGDVKISIENSRVPDNLKYVKVVDPREADLRFVVKGKETEVFNNVGDSIVRLKNNELNWQHIIDKERFLQTLSSQFDMRLNPVKFTLKEGDGLHKKEELLNFSVAPTNVAEGLKALTLFNLASNGELQFLYPLKEFRDSLTITNFPFKLPPIEVTPPFGGDSVVAILCQESLPSLHNLLANNEPNIPQPSEILNILKNKTCQIGQYAFFTTE